MTANPALILASASPRRRELLAQIGIVPAKITAADIDEAPHKNELPSVYAVRMATEKTAKLATEHTGACILAADTVVACGRRILPKAEDEQTARKCLTLLSGRRHRVYTGVALLMPGKKCTSRLVMTQVKFNRLDDKTIAHYLATNEWQGKAGGYAIQGAAAAFIPWINGSYSNVVGLPLAETAALLKAAGVINA